MIWWFRGSWRLICSSAPPLHQMAKLQVNIDITSDIACPWCWIGKKYLDTAMEHLKSDFLFNVHWKPFLLNPILPDHGIPMVDYCRLKFGEEGAQRILSQSSPIATQGRVLGITFNHNRMVVPTKKPHILLDFGCKHGKQHDLQEVLFRAYFTDGLDVSSDDVLKALAEEVGLDGNKALAALSSTEYTKDFEEGIKETKRKGISSVPMFEISLPGNPGVKQNFSGAQPVDTFVAVFGRLKAMSKM